MPKSHEELRRELDEIAQHLEKLHLDINSIDKRLKTEKGAALKREDEKRIEEIRKKLGLT